MSERHDEPLEIDYVSGIMQDARVVEPFVVKFTFKTKEEADLFRDYAMTAFDTWRFNTGRLGK